VKGIYPTFRGKTSDGKTIMEMVDSSGRVWGRGEHESRTEAIALARISMPTKDEIRKQMASLIS